MAQEPPPDAELEVLAAMWQGGESTAREVRESMESYRPMSHGAVSALLKRLVEKKLVARRKGPVGKALVFRARVQPSGTYRHILGKLVEHIFGGSSVALVTSLLETQPPTDEELEALHEVLDDLKSRRRRRRRSG